jgi:hypothetical protein
MKGETSLGDRNEFLHAGSVLSLYTSPFIIYHLTFTLQTSSFTLSALPLPRFYHFAHFALDGFPLQAADVLDEQLAVQVVDLMAESARQ